MDLIEKRQIWLWELGQTHQSIVRKNDTWLSDFYT